MTRYRTVKKHLLDTEYGEFELPHENIAEGDEIVVVKGTQAWVGFLAPDHDLDYPFDGDEWYQIYARGKYERENGDEELFQDALGRGRDWEPLISEEMEKQAHHEVVLAGLKKMNFAGDISIYRYDWGSGDGIAEITFRRGDRKPRLVNFYTRWRSHQEVKYGQRRDVWTHHLTFDGRELQIADPDERAKELWQAAIDAGELGNKYVVMLDVYDHSGVSWTVTGGGMSCQWDTSQGAGVWVPGKDCIEQIESQFATPEERWNEAVRMAKGACETYTAWANGWGYGAIVQEYEWKPDTSEGALEDDGEWEQLDSEDAWGLYGYDDAKSELKGMMTQYTKQEGTVEQA